MTSEARLPSRMILRAISHAPSKLGAHRQHSKARTGVRREAEEGLIDFMSNRCGQRAEACDSCDTREFGSHLASAASL